MLFKFPDFDYLGTVSIRRIFRGKIIGLVEVN